MKKKPAHLRDPDPAILAEVEQSIFAEAERNKSTAGERNALYDRIRDARRREVEREAQSSREILEKIMAAGERATGMTREQIMDKAAEYMGQPRPTKKRTWRELATARGVPEIHLRGVTDRQPIECEALRLVKELVKSTRQTILVLSGAVGLRKSGSACWALTQMEGRYVKAADLPKFKVNKADEWSGVWERLKAARLLVVDELGGEYTDDKGFFYTTINQLMEERYTGLPKTIITTNLDAAAFRATYGDRLASRVNECGQFVDLGGVDVRGTVEHWSDR